jgi:hypothetical protein
MDIDIKDTARTLSFEGRRSRNMAVTSSDGPEQSRPRKRLPDSDGPEQSRPRRRLPDSDGPEQSRPRRRLPDSDAPEQSRPRKRLPDSRSQSSIYPPTPTPLLASFSHSVFESPLGNSEDRRPSDRKLAWGNLRRREGAGRGGAPLGPTVRFAITVLEGAMVTGWYGSGFNLWPEENRRKLSDLIYKIWEEMALDQHRKARTGEDRIMVKPTEHEARKVTLTTSRVARN